MMTRGTFQTERGGTMGYSHWIDSETCEGNFKNVARMFPLAELESRADISGSRADRLRPTFLAEARKGNTPRFQRLAAIMRRLKGREYLYANAAKIRWQRAFSESHDTDDAQEVKRC